MTAEEFLEARRAEREALLQRAIRLLEQDERVVAAWLFGSFGRGEEDALSDLDLWLVVADAHCAAMMAERQTYVAQVGTPALLLEAPQNAPPDGAYLMALYETPTGTQQVDWYWQPQSQAKLPERARVLFDKVGLPASGLPPLTTAPPAPQTPEERVESAVQQIVFFWAMLPIAAKYAARRKLWPALGMMLMVRGILDEVRAKVGLGKADYGEDIPPATPKAHLAFLRRLASEMRATMPAVIAQGGSLPCPEAIPRILAFFDGLEPLCDD